MGGYAGNIMDAMSSYGKTIMAQHELEFRRQELAQHQQQIDMEHEAAQRQAQQSLAEMLGHGARPLDAQGNVSTPSVQQGPATMQPQPVGADGLPSVGHMTPTLQTGGTMQVPADPGQTVTMGGQRLQVPTADETFQRALGQKGQEQRQTSNIEMQHALEMRNATYRPLPDEFASALHMQPGTLVDPSKYTEYADAATKQQNLARETQNDAAKPEEVAAQNIAKARGLTLKTGIPAMAQLEPADRATAYQMAKQINTDPAVEAQRQQSMATSRALEGLLTTRSQEITAKHLPNFPNAPDGSVVNPIAQKIVNGDLDAQTTRRLIGTNPGLMVDINKIDPNFSMAKIQDRYNTLKEFGNTSVTHAGGQILALRTLIHHADLYQKTAEALHNGKFVPGNYIYNEVAKMFGAAPPTNAKEVAQFFASETGKVATGGVPAEGELKNILSNLNTNGSPEAMKQAGDTLLGIAAGRGGPLKETADQAGISKIKPILGPEERSILQSHGFDPDTLKQIPKTSESKTSSTAVSFKAPDGNSYTFPNAAALANFKKNAGIQ